METFGNKLGAKKGKKGQAEYYCEKCDFLCCKKYSFNRHLLTSKHLMETNGNILETEKGQKGQIFLCANCSKEFKGRSGLWKHKKMCNYETKCEHNASNNEHNSISDKHLITMIMEQNAELIKGHTELIKENSEMKHMMMKVIENGTNNTTNNIINNTNSHNKTFNLQFFLNETCKNALNIDDFVSSIKVSLTELENTGRRGYIEGISSIIIHKLNNLNQCDRPLHCSDEKRETMYIKNDNQWIKETEEKPILKKAIKTIANENIKQINAWRQQHPDCTNADSNKNNLYLKIVSNSMCGSTKEETEKNYEKIISNVAKQVIIDK